jgi:hypothetical protein
MSNSIPSTLASLNDAASDGSRSAAFQPCDREAVRGPHRLGSVGAARQHDDARQRLRKLAHGWQTG